jgi:hypothetical protein
MEEQLSELIESYLNLFIKFLQELSDVFLIQGVSLEFQQAAKLFFLLLVLFFALGIIVMITKVLSSLLTAISNIFGKIFESMSKRPSYIFYVVMAVLLIFFTSDVSFGAGCFALFIFLAMEMAYRGIKMFLENGPPALPDFKNSKKKEADSKSEWGVQ